MRALVADVIERLGRGGAPDKAALHIRLRAMQDEIGRLKHRHPMMAARPSTLAWVDDWSPAA